MRLWWIGTALPVRYLPGVTEQQVVADVPGLEVVQAGRAEQNRTAVVAGWLQRREHDDRRSEGSDSAEEQELVLVVKAADGRHTGDQQGVGLEPSRFPAFVPVFDQPGSTVEIGRFGLS